MSISPYSTQFTNTSREEVKKKQFYNENFLSTSNSNVKEKQANSRTILGPLSQNSNRIQPFRAAKQVGGFV